MVPPASLSGTSGDAPITPVAGWLRLSMAPRYPNNLPLQLTSFIGRENELSAIKQRLWTARLLTLTGPGGCGKTRLALRVATDLLDAFADGVWWVELAPLADPALVTQASAMALGLRADASRPILETLTDYLRSRQILLILDNCEHLIEACAQLIHALLQTCPDLYVMATSREVLRIGGEVAYVVPPLATPQPNQLFSVESLAQYEAVKLFVERAANAWPDFEMTERNAAAIAQVCYRLDGMPLAIELAAARVKMMPVDQIVARLDDRFRLLTNGHRTALLQHQTLRAAINWSYDLLTEDERRVLRRLSVFVGGWTLEAAETVCANREQAESAHIAPANVLDLLTWLVDKSLVIARREQVDETRYLMLETIRQYARDRLFEAGEVEQTRTHHLDFFLAFAVKARPNLYGPEQLIWFKRLDAECDNLRTAMDWALESGRAQSGLQLGGTLHPYWFARGYQRELRERLEDLLARPEAAERTIARADALNAAGHFAHFLNDPEAARTLLEEGQAISREQGIEGKYNLAWSLYFLAEGMVDRDRALAQRAVDESLMLAHEIGDIWVSALGFCLLGHLALRQGDYALARTFYREGMALSRETGDQWCYAIVSSSLGWALYLLGDYGAARSHLQEAKAIYRAVGDKINVAHALEDLGYIAQLQDDYQQATGFFEESLTTCREIGAKERIVWVLGALGIVKERLGDHARAAALLIEAVPLSQELGKAYPIAICVLALAGLQRQPLRAAQLLATAQSMFGASDTILEPFHRVEYERIESATRTALGEESFASAWAAGRAMSMEQAIAYALIEPDTSSPVNGPAPSSSALQEAKTRFAGLTAREREVAALIAQGKANRDIAAALVVELKTIEAHITHILNKLGFDNRVQIATWAMNRGLVPPPES